MFVQLISADKKLGVFILDYQKSSPQLFYDNNSKNNDKFYFYCIEIKNFLTDFIPVHPHPLKIK